MLAISLRAGEAAMDEEAKTEPGRRGIWKFYGVDVMVDEGGRFWLIEYNHSPAIGFYGQQESKDLTKSMLEGMLDILFDIRQRRLDGRPIEKDDRTSGAKTSWQRIEGI